MTRQTQYLTTTEAAAKWGIPHSTVGWRCRAGLIPGAIQIGDRWAIPATLEVNDLPEVRAGRKKQDEEGE